jgi:poly-gamma-glutamate synthesis protein (capsule biosynthesis protein)
MKLSYTLGPFCVLLFCACEISPQFDALTINGGGFIRENEFLLSLLGDTESLALLGFRLVPPGEAAETGSGPDSSGGKRREPERPRVFIDLVSSWEFENRFGQIPLSRTWYAPREDAPAGRGDTTLKACLEGGETLVPLSELEPSFIALRVGGLSVEDEGYPLIRIVGISIREEGPSPDSIPQGPIRKRIALKKIEKTHDELLVKVQALEEFLRTAAKPLVDERPVLFWIASGGDLMLDRGASEILFQEGPEGIFGETAEFLAQADLALVNLEGAVSAKGTKVKKSFNFRFVPPVAAALRDAGIDAVLQANNHAFDYGEEAFLDSLTHLREAGIGILGAGLNDELAAMPFLFQKADQGARVFGIASFPRERNGWDGLTAAAGTDKAGLLHAKAGGGEKLKAHFDREDEGRPEFLDIVLFHGGVEWSIRPDAFTREFYTDLIKHGADLIIGSHPHVVQGFEWILGKPVFWSLGNYVFGGMENTDGGEEGLFIKLGFLGSRLVYLEPFALALSHTRTSIAPAEELSRFYVLSKELRDRRP